MEYVFEIVGYIVKFGVTVLALMYLSAYFVGLFAREKPKESHVEVEVLGKDILKPISVLDSYVSAEDEEKAQEYSFNRSSGRVLAFSFDGDSDISTLQEFEEQVDVICGTVMDCDEVVLRVTSYGGCVSRYGLVAEYINRIKRTGAQVTVCIDEAAASGGYLIACAADKIIASPWALVGSVGVVSELPNFNSLMKKHGVDYEVLTAGKYKRTLSSFGEITEEGRENHRKSLIAIHDQFRSHVKNGREGVDIEQVATGETWLGHEAKEMGLVDELLSYREYLWRRCVDDHMVVLQVSYKQEHSMFFADKLLNTLKSVVERKLNMQVQAK